MRIEVTWRQPHRSQPLKPRRGRCGNGVVVDLHAGHQTAVQKPSIQPWMRPVRLPHRPVTSSRPSTISIAPPNRMSTKAMLAQPPEHLARTLNPERERKEGQPQPKAIRDGEHDAPPLRALGEAQRENRRKRRANARRPAQAKGHAEQRRSRKARARAHVHAALRLEERHGAHEREPHEDDHHPKDAADHLDLIVKLRAKRGDPDGEQDEHRGEAGDEQEHAEHEAWPRALRGHVRARHAAHVAQVAGHQRHDARGREAHESGEDGDGDRSEERAREDGPLTAGSDRLGASAAASSMRDLRVDGSASPMMRA